MLDAEALVFVQGILQGDLVITSNEVNPQNNNAIISIHDNTVYSIDWINLDHLPDGGSKRILTLALKALLLVFEQLQNSFVVLGTGVGGLVLRSG